MISAFGIISAVVAIAAVAALVLHFKLMQKRGAVDDALAEINALLFLAEDEDGSKLSQTTSEDIEAATGAYNDAVDVYNAYISCFPGKMMASIVGLKKEQGM